MDQKIAFGFGGILVGAAIVLLLSSTGQYRSMMWGANGSNITTPNRTVGMMNNIDEHFIEQMIPHHELAIIMAQMLKAGTNRPEMLTLANNITESQSKEIEQMQSWYKSWYK